MSYVDLNTIHNPATGTVAPASWGDQVRDNLEFLIDPPACSVFGSGQNVASGSDTVLTAPSENYDNDAMHSTVSNTSRITVVTPGRYEALAVVRFAANATGYRVTRFLVNGAQFTCDSRPAAPTIQTAIPIQRTFTLAAGDYVEVQVLQNSGSTLAVDLIEFALLYRTR